MNPKPIIVLEVPLFYNDNQIESLESKIRESAEGYIVITIQKDVNDINIKF